MKRYIKSTVDIDQLPWVDSLTVTDYFDDFIKANIKNPDFFQWGRDEASHEDIVDLWRELRTEIGLQDIHEIPIEDAIEIAKNSIRGVTHERWFRGAERSAKPVLLDQILSRPDVLNAGLNIAYYNYIWDCKIKNTSPLPFQTWLYTPQIMYRGETGVTEIPDVFVSYTPDPKVASKFGNYTGGTVHRIKIRPIDTWGSYQTNGEYEFLVPKKFYKKKY